MHADIIIKSINKLMTKIKQLENTLNKKNNIYDLNLFESKYNMLEDLLIEYDILETIYIENQQWVRNKFKSIKNELEKVIDCFCNNFNYDAIELYLYFKHGERLNANEQFQKLEKKIWKKLLHSDYSPFLDINELSEIITNNHEIKIIQTFSNIGVGFFYNQPNWTPNSEDKTFIIKSNKPITKRYVLNELMKQNFRLDNEILQSFTTHHQKNWKSHISTTNSEHHWVLHINESSDPKRHMPSFICIRTVPFSFYTKYIIELLEMLVPALTNRVKAHHTLYSIPLLAENWEESLSRAFEEIGHPTTWTNNRSHKIGEDMSIKNIPNSRISCKSGQFINDRSLGKICVKINGSRSTSFATLEEKIAHFSESHDDYYFLLAKDKKFNKKYKLLVFESSICRVNKLTWTESASGKAWNGEGDFKACISKSMSGQLWTTIPLDMIPYQFDIDCS
jgi:hypothetical protein